MNENIIKFLVLIIVGSNTIGNSILIGKYKGVELLAGYKEQKMENIDKCKLARYYGRHLFFAGLIMLICGFAELFIQAENPKLITYIGFGLYLLIIIKMVLHGLIKFRRGNFDR